MDRSSDVIEAGIIRDLQRRGALDCTRHRARLLAVVLAGIGAIACLSALKMLWIDGQGTHDLTYEEAREIVVDEQQPAGKRQGAASRLYVLVKQGIEPLEDLCARQDELGASARVWVGKIREQVKPK